MNQLRIYSSAPLRSTQLAVALLGLEAQDIQVQLRPLAELPAGPHPRLASLRLELEQTCTRLATIGDVLTAHADGQLRLEAGDEQGLLAERESLQARKRGLERSLGQQGQRGGAARG